MGRGGEAFYEVQNLFIMETLYRLAMEGDVYTGGTAVKNPPANARDAGLIPGSGKSLGDGNSNSLQCFCLENPLN